MASNLCQEVHEWRRSQNWSWRLGRRPLSVRDSTTSGNGISPPSSQILSILLGTMVGPVVAWVWGCSFPLFLRTIILQSHLCQRKCPVLPNSTLQHFKKSSIIRKIQSTGSNVQNTDLSNSKYPKAVMFKIILGKFTLQKAPPQPHASPWLPWWQAPQKLIHQQGGDVTDLPGRISGNLFAIVLQQRWILCGIFIGLRDWLAGIFSATNADLIQYQKCLISMEALMKVQHVARVWRLTGEPTTAYFDKFQWHTLENSTQKTHYPSKNPFLLTIMTNQNRWKHKRWWI